MLNQQAPTSYVNQGAKAVEVSQLESTTNLLRSTLDGLADDINQLRLKMTPVIMPVPLRGETSSEKGPTPVVAPHIEQLDNLVDRARALRGNVQELTNNLCS